MGNGPKSWPKQKQRMKRPSTTEQKLSHEQKVGRIPRQTVSRPAPPEPKKSAIKKKHAAPLQSGEKRLRALNKLLREIEELQRKAAAGAELDEQQEAKLDRLDGVLDEMETLMAGGAGGAQ